jgi:hypothetical protein
MALPGSVDSGVREEVAVRHSIRVCALLVLLAVSLAGQDTAIVQGTVSISREGPTPGVTVTAIDENTGASFSTVTDASGRYVLQLPPGRYTVTCELAGFSVQRRTGIVVKGTRVVNIPLSTGGEAQGNIGTKSAPRPPPPPPVAPTKERPRPPTQAPSSGETKTALNSLSWNAWADAYPGPVDVALPRLSRNTDYLLVLHLSGNPYDQPGVSVQPASGDVSGWLHEWLNVGKPTTSLQVLALPDANYFSVVDDRVKPLEVDLVALREWSRSPPTTPPSAPLADIRRARENGQRPGFVFGEALFRLKTTNRQGVAAVGLSIWSAEGRPLDEVSVSFCVADSPTDVAAPLCQGVRPIQQTLKGADSVRIAADGASSPDAALHFVELDNRGVVGVFRDNACRDCGYKVWTLGKNGTDLRNYLANTILPAFGPAAAIPSLSDAGRGLYNLLFPDDDGDADRAAARAAFETFVAREVRTGDAATPSRSIFVRTLLAGPLAEPLYLPLGLMTVPGAPDEFLGFHFRFEAPLERQTYRPSASCISRWYFAAPAPNAASADPVPQASARFETLMTAWSPRLQGEFSSIPRLRTWVSQPKPTEASAALVVVSHHDQNALYFEQNEKLIPEQVQRRFGEASVVVLNGCSTGAPMAADLLRQFNQRGMATAIVSQVAVRPELAGDFVAQFGEIVEGSNGGKGGTIADMFLRTLQELRTKKADATSSAYGPRVLVFSLLGNGATRICPPQKE